MFVLLKGWGAMLDRYPQTAKSIIAGVVAALLAGAGFFVLGMAFKDPFDASMVMVVTIGVALFVYAFRLAKRAVDEKRDDLVRRILSDRRFFWAGIGLLVLLQVAIELADSMLAGTGLNFQISWMLRIAFLGFEFFYVIVAF